MPANLNALIRYKQIDLCLRNPYLKATIAIMQEKCSDQLAEHRGIYKLVSERTIRDDIKTMRSDALNFNAPIVVKDGVYRYSDDQYSIFNTSISEMALLKEIIKLLIEEKDHIKSTELDGILTELSVITGIKIDAKVDTIQMEETLPDVNKYNIRSDYNYNKLKLDLEDFPVIKQMERSRSRPFSEEKLTRKSIYLWEKVFEVIEYYKR